MESLLWKLSTATQIASAVMIALSFPIVTRGVLRPERQWWSRAWAMNCVALGVTVVFWTLEPPVTLYPLVRALYVGAKTASLLFLIEGAWAARSDGDTLLRAPWRWALLVGCALAGAFVLSSVDLIGIGEQALIGIALATCPLVLARTGERALVWLAVACAVRALTGFVESSAYAAHLYWAPPAGDARNFLSMFLAAHSFFDAGAEWLIALGCVVVLSERRQRELQQRNVELREREAAARREADRDPLTGLPNRRALTAILERAESRGAFVAFFDIDDFKTINDTVGHHAGDEALREFAAALKACVGRDGYAVRYAGDEFVAVIPKSRHEVDARLDVLRKRLAQAPVTGRAVEFSVGISMIEPGGQGDLALRAADQAMYRAKTERRATRGIEFTSVAAR